ncbi:MAG: ComEC/Rec2 family competence protein [Oscillospiraceae bacterium]|nr:ComEC/Rec2 family competence protein [Oscillospiraceae bacterium]
MAVKEKIMTRKAVWFGVPYVLGLFFAVTLSYFTVEFPRDLLSPLIITPFLIFIGVKVVNTPKKLIVVLAAFVIGFWCYNIYYLTSVKPIENLDKQTVSFSGRIAEIGGTKEDQSSYVFEGRVGDLGGRENFPITLNYYGSSLICDYNDKITADVTLEKIVDKYTFPAKKYYNSKNTYFEITKLENLKIQHPQFSFKRDLMHFREKLIKQFKYVLDGEELGICVALIFGDTALIDEETETILQKSGISHVTSVSGFHLVLITGILVYFFKFLRVNRKVSFFLIVAILMMFAMVTTFPVAMIRSLIMCIIWLSAELFLRQADLLNSLCLAVIFMTITTPYLFTNVSFLLSITGVFGIGVVAPYLSKNINKYLKPFVFMTVVAVAILPVSLLFFDFTSLISPIANVIFVPFLSFACILLALSGFCCVLTLFAYPLIWIAGLCCKIVIWGLNILNMVPTLPLGNDNYKYVMLLLVGFIIVIFCYKPSVKNLSLLICSCFVAFLGIIGIINVSNNELKVKTFGTATIISKGKNADIIDKGDRFDYKSVLQYLNENNITQINAVYLLKNEQYLYAKYYNLDYKYMFVRNDAFIGNLKNVDYIGSGMILRYKNYQVELCDNSEEAFILNYSSG